MATLTETAYFSRRAIKYGAIALVCYIILRILLTLVSAWWRAAHPPPPPPATVTFGELPPLLLPKQDKPPLVFRLETVDGTTGEFGPNANVYVIPEERGSLLALERSTELANRLDFESDPARLSSTLYRWSTVQPLPASLEVDLLTEHFIYDVNWRAQPQLLSNAQALSETNAIAEARNWLSQIRLLSSDLGVGDARVTYLKVSGTEIVPAVSQSDAQFMRVDLFRSNVTVGEEDEEGFEEFPVLPLDPGTGIVSVMLLRPSRARTMVVHGEYRHIPVDYSQSATYPLEDTQVSWKRLTEGEGFYAVLPEGVSQVAIRRISLAYLEPPEAGAFMQPIYVFEGDLGFLAYLPAVSQEYLLGDQ